MGFCENTGLVWTNPSRGLFFFRKNLVTSSSLSSHKSQACAFSNLACEVSTCLNPYSRINSFA